MPRMPSRPPHVMGLRPTKKESAFVRPSRSIRVVLALTVTMLAAAACGSSNSGADGKNLTSVSFRMGWTMSGYMAPFNLAVQRGYYTDQGLDVKIGEGKGSVTTAQTVANGSDDFGFADASSVAPLIAKGAPLKVVAVFQQETASAIIYKSSTQITKVSDLLGHPIIHGASDNTTQVAHALVGENGISWSQLNSVVVQPSSYEQAFLTTPNGILLGSYNSTYQAIKTKDASAQAKPFQDFGINVLSYALITTNKMISQHPGEVKAMVAASVKGWQQAQQDPQAAVDATVKAFPTANKDIQMAQLKSTFGLLHTEATQGKPLGWMAESDWKQTLQIMSQYGGLSGSTTPSEYYTNEFIPSS